MNEVTEARKARERIEFRLERLEILAGPDGLLGAMRRLEAKLDFLTKALEAGAVGRWDGMGPRP